MNRRRRYLAKRRQADRKWVRDFNNRVRSQEKDRHLQMFTAEDMEDLKARLLK